MGDAVTLCSEWWLLKRMTSELSGISHVACIYYYGSFLEPNHHTAAPGILCTQRSISLLELVTIFSSLS